MIEVYEVKRCVPDCLFGEKYTIATFFSEEAKKLRRGKP